MFFWNRSVAIMLLLAAILYISLEVHSESLAIRQTSESQSNPLLLEQGKTIEREIKGGESHTYQLNLSAGQFLHVMVEQNRIDLYASFHGSGDSQLMDIKGWDHYLGKMPIYWIAAETGSYRIRVYPANKEATNGKYRIRIEELRAASDEDRVRISAQAAFIEAYKLKLEGSKESKTKSIKLFSDALSIYKTLNDQYAQGIVLNYIGKNYTSLGEPKKALDYHNQALTLFKQLGDRVFEAEVLSEIGVAYFFLADKKKALEYYTQALALNRELGNLPSEANNLNDIGVAYNDLGEKQKALEYLNQVGPIKRQLGDRPGEASTLNNIGKVYNDLGDMRKALDYYNQALPLFRQIGDRDGEAIALNNIGVAYNSLGEKQKAFDYHNQALIIYKEVGNRTGEAIALQNIGAFYNTLGEKQRALEYLNQALSLVRKTGYRTSEAATLNTIGSIYNELGEKQKALDYYNQALPLRKQVGDRSGEATTLSNIGEVYRSLEERQKALDYYNQALVLQRQVGSRSGEAATLNNLGAIYNDLGEKQKALDYYNQALLLRRQEGNRPSEASILFNIAKLEAEQGNLTDARSKIENAIKLKEFIRTSVAGQELRSSFFTTARQYYELQIDLLMRLHKANPEDGLDALALQASELSRARSLVELLTEAKIDIREGGNSKLIEREKNLQELVNNKAEILLRLKNRKNATEQAAQMEKEINDLISELKEVGDQIRASSPKYASLTKPEAISLKEVQQLLDADTLLLEYSLGEKRSYLWLVSQTSIKSFELPARKQIEDRAREFYNQLTLPVRDAQATNIDYKNPASELGKMLLGPAQEQLGKKRLFVVAEGALQYIPFSALSLQSDQYAPLILDHEIASIPSVSTLAVQRRDLANRPAADRLLAVIADPVFEQDDSRVKQSLAKRKETEQSPGNEPEQSALLRSAEEIETFRDKGLARLLGSRREANAIASLTNKEKVLKALDFDASRETVTSEELSKYRFIHIATHGLLNSKNPDLSGVVLSLVDKEGNPERGFLKLNEIYNLKLNADLVVLSGCQTGLGKEIRGEGLVGLTRGFMYAGAKSIVASLWSVQDFTTSELMTSFYQAMIKEGKSPAEALRLAQIKMFKKAQKSNPYYWAGFTFQGDWR